MEKNRFLTYCLALLLTMGSFVIVLRETYAQEPGTKQTYPYCNAIPNPVGVNQEVLLHIGIMHQLAHAGLGWEGITVTVTDPQGNNETLGPYTTDSTGGTGALFTPTQVGSYTLVTNFPEQINPAATRPGTIFSGVVTPEGTIMLAGQSNPLELVVQSEPVQYYPAHSLPTEYWVRPIDAQLREWAAIAGNWLENGFYLPTPNKIAPYNDGPKTPHILWAKPFTTGGIVGGEIDHHAFEEGDAYEGKWNGAIILAGKLYYQNWAANEVGPRVTYCVDLHTGEELWSKVFLDNQSIAFGQTMYWDTLQYHGTFDYLWVTVGSTWHAFDAFTGEWAYAIENVPSGARTVGPNGEYLIYSVDTENARMTKWNSTHAYYNSMLNETGGDIYTSGRWRPFGNTYDGAFGIEWNVSITEGLPGATGQPLGHNGLMDDRILGFSITPQEVTSWALSTEKGSEGDLIFMNTYETPAAVANNNLTLYFEAASNNGQNGVFTIGVRELRKHWGFSSNTGEFLWETEGTEIFLNWLGIPREHPPVIAENKLLHTHIGGIVYCYSTEDGRLLWKYEAEDKYQEFLFGNNWWLYPLFVTDGNIYYGSLEHSPIDPKPRGAPFICLDLQTGEEVWRSNGLFRQSLWGGRAIIADSVIATQDTYDQRVYAIGKGPSVTTVDAPLSAVTVGVPVTISGTVMDASPGTEDAQIKLRFPNGLPVISDSDMDEWMLYAYKQFERPANAVGVEVKIQAVNPDLECVDLGTTTSDSYGNYGFTFSPEKEGQYVIIATFEGSKGYYGSTATAYLSAGTVTPSTPIEPEQPEETPVITIEIAIIAAVAVAIVISVVAYLMRNRR